MKTGVFPDVGSYVFVTVKTQLLLTFLVEQLVARRAFRLEFGVSFDNFAGHHKRLDILSSCAVRCKQCNHHHQSE
jgi:hypothetical protein